MRKKNILILGDHGQAGQIAKLLLRAQQETCKEAEPTAKLTSFDLKIAPLPDKTPTEQEITERLLEDVKRNHNRYRSAPTTHLANLRKLKK